jgi:hypothetical protein
MNHPLIPALAGLAFVVFASVARTETLVEYTFTPNNTTTSRNASTVGANVTTNPFANGAGVTISSSSLGSPDVRSFYVNGNLVEQAISSTSTDWIGFTISATSGNVLSLQTLGFAYGCSYNSGTAPTTPATFDVRSSVDGFASSLDSFTASVGATPMAFDWGNASVVLTDAAFQGLGAIEFRVFLNDGANANDASYLRIDTVTLTGVSTAPVPEPAGVALLAGAAGLAVAGARRRALVRAES